MIGSFSCATKSQKFSLEMRYVLLTSNFRKIREIPQSAYVIRISEVKKKTMTIDSGSITPAGMFLKFVILPAVLRRFYQKIRPLSFSIRNYGTRRNFNLSATRGKFAKCTKTAGQLTRTGQGQRRRVATCGNGA